MSDLNLDNITWDLEGLVSLDELKLDFTDIELLISIFSLTESYTRFQFLGVPIEFTTTEEIFNKTGLFKIVYESKKKKDSYYFMKYIIKKVHLIGNSEILYYYSNEKLLHLGINSSVRYIYHIDMFMDKGHRHFLDFKSFMYLICHTSFNIPLYNSLDLLNLDSFVDGSFLSSFSYPFIYIGIRLDLEIKLEFFDLDSLTETNLYYMYLLSNYCNSIILKINSLGNSFSLQSLPSQLISLLYSCPTIKLLGLRESSLEIENVSVFNINSILKTEIVSNISFRLSKSHIKVFEDGETIGE